MHMTPAYLDYYQDDSVQLLVMPYKGEHFQMVLLLPRADGLDALEKRLNPVDFGAWVTAARNRKVGVMLPKFKLGSGSVLNRILQALGVTDAFVQGRADFSGMDDRRGALFLSKVLHKAVIEVDEKGTEAAASTLGILVQQSLPPQFFANHPFLFLVRETGTGTILFMGRVADPSSNDIETRTN